MIQKLRRKFIAVIMGVAAVILLTVFVVLAVSTSTGMQRQNIEMLQKTLNGDFHKNGNRSQSQDAILPQEPGAQAGQGTGESKNSGKNKPWGRFPSFTATVAQDGTVTLQERDFFLQDEFTTEEIETIARTAAESDGDSGTLSAYRLRYMKKSVDSGTLVAFADTSSESSAMAELVKNSLILGAVSLLAFFGVSILLARWAVRPVETAWMQQKQFVGDASHELKTPLTVILSNADMILTHPGQDEQRWAENIKVESVRMKKLTEELLSLARSDDSQRKTVEERVDFSYLVTDSVLLYEPSVYESGKTLSSQVAENLFVSGDPAGLSQLLGILLENAIKYSGDGAGISVRLEPAGKSVRLSVINTGAPIPPEELSRIFERFYRGDPSRQNDGGHGLGLAIARSVAAAHHGKIWAESAGGLNSFHVLLPTTK